MAFTGADHGVERGVEQDYERGVPLAEALRDDVLLVHTMNGQPLPPQHGYPLRLLVPGWYRMAQVKWLVRISALDAGFGGYQNVTTYRLEQDPDKEGDPVARMRPQALLVPPGFPEFHTRARILDRGVPELTGRAWSGWTGHAGRGQRRRRSDLGRRRSRPTAGRLRLACLAPDMERRDGRVVRAVRTSD